MHKPLHVPSGTMLQSAFSNGMVYNKATPWARHTNQHQKVIFPTEGCKVTSPSLTEEETPLQVPALLSVCLHFRVLATAHSYISPLANYAAGVPATNQVWKKKEVPKQENPGANCLWPTGTTQHLPGSSYCSTSTGSEAPAKPDTLPGTHGSAGRCFAHTAATRTGLYSPPSLLASNSSSSSLLCNLLLPWMA